jgi:hypothetical protein
MHRIGLIMNLMDNKSPFTDYAVGDSALFRQDAIGIARLCYVF